MTIKRFLISIIFVFGIAQLSAQSTETKIDTNVLMTNITDLNESDNVNTNLDNLIEKYDGKVIYLDFWASWCRPCKGEMPHSLKMQDKFKDKDVAFVYISTDRDANAWQKAISSLNITGEHYRVNKNVHSQMNERFNVQYIPRYVLIDKKGNVVDANAKRPSNSEVAADIEKLL